MLSINDKITIPAEYINIRYIRSRGPGGQNVNKVNTRAQLTFDLKNCELIPSAAKKRLVVLAGRRVTNAGTLIIESDRFRQQRQNRNETLLRLRRLIREALITPKKRRPTKPTTTSIMKRRADKIHRSKIKSLRQKVL